MWVHVYEHVCVCRCGAVSASPGFSVEVSLYECVCVCECDYVVNMLEHTRTRV